MCFSGFLLFFFKTFFTATPSGVQVVLYQRRFESITLLIDTGRIHFFFYVIRIFYRRLRKVKKKNPRYHITTLMNKNFQIKQNKLIVIRKPILERKKMYGKNNGIYINQPLLKYFVVYQSIYFLKKKTEVKSFFNFFQKNTR